MKELLESLAESFDDAEGWIRIVGAKWWADDLKLNLSVQFHDNRAVESWEVICSGAVEESVCSNQCEILTLSADSPLLKPFVEPQVSIMFSQNAMAAETLFGIVCSCCIDVMGRPDSITKFINAAPVISGISSSDYGLLGRFPESLATRIIDSLKDRPIEAKALPGHFPTRWDGKNHVNYQNLSVLEIGRSYVVAEQFCALRVQEHGV